MKIRDRLGVDHGIIWLYGVVHRREENVPTDTENKGGNSLLLPKIPSILAGH